MSPERYLFTTSSLSEEIKVPVFETLKTVKSSFMNPQRLISKAVKSRVPRSYRRNESKPEIPKRKREHQIYPREESPDMLMLDLFLAHLKTMRSCQKNMGLSYRCFELRRDTWNE